MVRSSSDGQLMHWMSVAVLAGIAVFSSFVAYLAVASRMNATPVAQPLTPFKTVNEQTSALPPGSYPSEPLAAGTPAPPLHATGWLNGEPQQPGDGAKLIVLDIWSHWCPMCRQTAPGLVRLQQRFADKQVAFVSLTNINESQVKVFVDEFKIPWPCGYGASLKNISRFGAYNPARSSAGFTRGLEVTPTMYVIGPDGRVLWNDAQARPRHLKESEALVRDLEAELDRLLSVG